MHLIQEHLKACPLSAARRKEVQALFHTRWDMAHSDFHAAGYALDPEFWDHDVGSIAEVLQLRCCTHHAAVRTCVQLHAPCNCLCAAALLACCAFICCNSVDMCGCAQVTEGLMTVVERLMPDDSAQVMVEYNTYRRGEGLFARKMVRDSIGKVSAHSWWDLYGASTPLVQQLAMKVLAQPSSACACERSWSTMDFIHSKKRNRLSAKRAADLVFVYSNRRLLDKLEKVGYTEAVLGSDSESES